MGDGKVWIEAIHPFCVYLDGFNCWWFMLTNLIVVSLLIISTLSHLDEIVVIVKYNICDLIKLLIFVFEYCSKLRMYISCQPPMHHIRILKMSTIPNTAHN